MAERVFSELLQGKGAHANSLACVDDVSAELSARQITGFPHSIWQIVWHMNFWMEYELQRIQGSARSYPVHASESWPMDSSPASPLQWHETVSTFSALLQELATLTAGDPQTLSRELKPAQPEHADRDPTVRATLWQLLVHNSYHLGQIAVIRRCLGAWPPRGGGDSW